MTSIDLYLLDDLDRRFRSLQKDIPGLRREMHTRAAKAIQLRVRGEIRASINDRHGKIQNWQEHYVGSGGGYAAVRPVAGGERGKNPGAITNYLESGHRVRLPSGKAKRWRKSRAKQYTVRGYHFYRRIRTQAQAIAIEAADRYVDLITERLGDQ